MQSFSIIAWRPGASCGETTLAPIADSASLSEKNSWASDRPPITTTIVIRPAPAVRSTPMKTTYSRPSRNNVSSMRA